MEFKTDLRASEADTECESCKIITEQYAYLKDRLEKQSLTIDTLLTDRAHSENGPVWNQTVETANFMIAPSTDEPNDVEQCQRIIRGMRQLIQEKDAELYQMSQIPAQRGMGRAFPIEIQKEMNVLRQVNNSLSKKTKELMDEKKYLERVQRDQGRALSKKKVETNQTTLKAQEDEIRHMKRKKFEVQTQLEKLTKENITLRDSNRSLIMQIKEGNIEKSKNCNTLDGQEPGIVSEQRKVIAQLQNQFAILKKSNNQLRSQKQKTLDSTHKQLEEKDEEIQRLQVQIGDKDHLVKIMKFKLKEMLKGNSGAININEKMFVDVQQMVNMTGSTKLPPTLQQKRIKDAGELYNFRNRPCLNHKKLNRSGQTSGLSRSIERSVDNNSSSLDHSAMHIMELQRNSMVTPSLSAFNDDADQLLPMIKPDMSKEFDPDNDKVVMPDGSLVSDSRNNTRSVQSQFVSRKNSLRNVKAENNSSIARREAASSLLRLNLDDKPIEVKLTGASTTKANRRNLKDKIAEESQRLKKPKKRNNLFKETQRSRDSVKSRFNADMPSSLSSVNKRHAVTEQDELISPVTPQLSRVRQGSSHRGTQARQHVINEVVRVQNEQDGLMVTLGDIVDPKVEVKEKNKMNSTIIELEETPTPCTSQTQMALYTEVSLIEEANLQIKEEEFRLQNLQTDTTTEVKKIEQTMQEIIVEDASSHFQTIKRVESEPAQQPKCVNELEENKLQDVVLQTQESQEFPQEERLASVQELTSIAEQSIGDAPPTANAEQDDQFKSLA